MICHTVTHSVQKTLKFVTPVNGRIPRYGHVYNILKILAYEPATKTQIKKILPYSNQTYKTLICIEKKGLVKNDNGLFRMTEEGEFMLKNLDFKLNLG